MHMLTVSVQCFANTVVACAVRRRQCRKKRLQGWYDSLKPAVRALWWAAAVSHALLLELIFKTYFETSFGWWGQRSCLAGLCTLRRCGCR